MSGFRRAWSRAFLMRDFGIAIVALLIGLGFSLASPVFLSAYNLLNLLRQTAELGIIAMAMTMLIISGEFDLSVGAIYAVTGVVTGLLANIRAGDLGGSHLRVGLRTDSGTAEWPIGNNDKDQFLHRYLCCHDDGLSRNRHGAVAGQPISSFQFETAFFDITGRGKGFR